MPARSRSPSPDNSQATAAGKRVDARAAGAGQRTAPAAPRSVQAVLALQRRAGNRATARLLGSAGGPGPLVLRKALEKDKLNVAGETHGESGPRRAAETKYAAEKTGGGYWTEGELKAKSWLMGAERYGDPMLLRAEMLLAIMKEKSLPNFLTPFASNQLPAAFASLQVTVADAWETYRTRLSQDLREVATALSGALTDTTETEAAEAALRAEKTYGRLLTIAGTVDKSGVDAAATIAGYIGGAITMFATDVLKLSDIRAEAVVSDLRSKAMHSAATDEAGRWRGKTGLWKVGDTHIAEMSQAAKGNPAYVLMTKDEFNADFDTWQQAQQP